GTFGRCITLDRQDLLDDLPRLEVPQEPQPSCLAKDATQAAPRLRRHADRKPWRQERDPHGLEQRAVRGAEQVLDETVERALASVELDQSLRAPPLLDLGGERTR